MTDMKTAGITDDAVAKATGKSWKEWISLLDKVKASNLPHKEIAKLLHDKHGLSGWWSQMITVGYEQAKGLRKAHERPEGFQISRSKTIDAPVTRIFRLISDNRMRSGWLDSRNFKISRKNENKNVRARWKDGKTLLSIELYYKKDKSKTQVVIQHSRLQSAAQAEKMKKYWGDRLDNLKTMAENS